MLKKICSGYFSTPLIYRIGAAFVIGILAGMTLSCAGSSMGEEWLHRAVAWISPFGTVLIAMLKMIVIPIIFFSLVCGASSLSVKKFGKLGSGVLLWYLFSSLAASVFGVFLAEPVSDILAATITTITFFSRFNGILERGAAKV